jgi:hypothetical protein
MHFPEDIPDNIDPNDREAVLAWAESEDFEKKAAEDLKQAVAAGVCNERGEMLCAEGLHVLSSTRDGDHIVVRCQPCDVTQYVLHAPLHPDN